MTVCTCAAEGIEDLGPGIPPSAYPALELQCRRHGALAYERDGVRLFTGHVLDVLALGRDAAVNLGVTSPPYWSLRRYEGPTDTVWGGDPKCSHEWGGSSAKSQESYSGRGRWQHDGVSRAETPEAWGQLEPFSGEGKAETPPVEQFSEPPTISDAEVDLGRALAGPVVRHEPVGPQDSNQAVNKVRTGRTPTNAAGLVDVSITIKDTAKEIPQEACRDDGPLEGLTFARDQAQVDQAVDGRTRPEMNLENVGPFGGQGLADGGTWAKTAGHKPAQILVNAGEANGSRVADVPIRGEQAEDVGRAAGPSIEEGDALLATEFGETFGRTGDGPPILHPPGPIDTNATDHASEISSGSAVGTRRGPVMTHDSSICHKCGAFKGQLGLEPTVELFIEHLMEVMAAIHRVLKPTGVCWINLGDSYASTPKGNPGALSNGLTNRGRAQAAASMHRTTSTVSPGLKPKDLVLVPERFALAAQAQGWWVRSRIAWTKPNPMPESARDRPTDAWETIWMLTKSGKTLYWTHSDGRIQGKEQGRPKPDYYWTHYKTDREAGREPPNWRTLKDSDGLKIWQRHNRWEGHDYWYDAEAVREPQTGNAHSRGSENGAAAYQEARGSYKDFRSPAVDLPGGRNMRNVWQFPTSPTPFRHFATFPPALPARCIAASCPAEVCSACGKARERVMKKAGERQNHSGSRKPSALMLERRGAKSLETSVFADGLTAIYETTGWTDCGCGAPFAPGVVLDPFAGSATTLIEARKLGRQAIGIEISPEYAEMARKRLDYGVRGVQAIEAGQAALL